MTDTEVIALTGIWMVVLCLMLLLYQLDHMSHQMRDILIALTGIGKEGQEEEEDGQV